MIAPPHAHASIARRHSRQLKLLHAAAHNVGVRLASSNRVLAIASGHVLTDGAFKAISPRGRDGRLLYASGGPEEALLLEENADADEDDDGLCLEENAEEEGLCLEENGQEEEEEEEGLMLEDNE